MTPALIIAIIALAVLVRSVWGFGDGMLALPLMVMVIGFEQAAPLMALLSAVIAVWLLRERPELVEKASLVRLVIGAIAGVPVGLYVLVGLPVLWAHALLSVLLIGFSLWSLLDRREHPATPETASPGRHGSADPSEARGGGGGDATATGVRAWALDLAFGALAGACMAAYDIAGPPMLIYAAVRGWSPDELRVNLQAVFLPLSLLTVAGHAAAGLWNREILLLAAMGLPIVVLGLLAGPKLRAWIGKIGGERLVYVLILCLGIVELVTAGLHAWRA